MFVLNVLIKGKRERLGDSVGRRGEEEREEREQRKKEGREGERENRRSIDVS